MARLNSATSITRKGTGTVRTSAKVIVNDQGGLGFKRDARSELFLAAVTSFNEDTYYESAKARQARIAGLTEGLVDDIEWLTGLVTWLRRDVGLRSIPTVVAVAAVHARLALGMSGGNRALIRAAIGRVDEAADVVAHWTAMHGKPIPTAVKRGVADALNERLTETSFLKWRGRADRGAYSIRDLLNITRVAPADAHQDALFGAVMADAYNRTVDDSALPVVHARRKFLALPTAKQVALLSGPEAAKTIEDARLTHEVIAGALGKIPAKVWQRLVPTMGYQALRMNLRRISESGVDRQTLNTINGVLSDPEKVAASRTMPMEFLAAYRNAPLAFADALQQGAMGALANVPTFRGRTLILVDRSGSMAAPMSSRGTLTRSDAANVFAAALALRCEDAEVVSYDTSFHRQTIGSTDLLRVAEALPRPGGGTDTRGAVQYGYNGHDRVIVLTDEQDGGYWYHSHPHTVDVFEGIVPNHIPTFTWNLAGYEAAHGNSGPARFTFGGLSDKGFNLMQRIEAGFSDGWPWEK